MDASTTANRGVTLEELVALFLGDADSAGYAHTALVMAICERLGPGNFEQLRGALYPDRATATLDGEIQRILRIGYFRWKKSGRPRSEE